MSHIEARGKLSDDEEELDEEDEDEPMEEGESQIGRGVERTYRLHSEPSKKNENWN